MDARLVAGAMLIGMVAGFVVAVLWHEFAPSDWGDAPHPTSADGASSAVPS